MQHLFDEWNEIKPLLKRGSVALFLDYDGTLTPIVAHPQLASLEAGRKKILEHLANKKNLRITIISGRPLEEIKRQVGVQGLIYVGNHGLEFEGPSIRFVHPGAQTARPLMSELAERLKIALESFQGVFVENKTISLSLHYRQLDPDKAEEARAAFSHALAPYQRKIKVTEGKKVWEVRPLLPWNKGTAVEWLITWAKARASNDVLPLYVGDDQTDEDAFKILKSKGITVKVAENGDDASQASYFIRSTDEVFELLNRLRGIQFKRGKIYV